MTAQIVNLDDYRKSKRGTITRRIKSVVEEPQVNVPKRGGCSLQPDYRTMTWPKQFFKFKERKVDEPDPTNR